MSFFFFIVVLGDITQKGYEKKKAKLLACYLPLAQGKANMLALRSSYLVSWTLIQN